MWKTAGKFEFSAVRLNKLCFLFHYANRIVMMKMCLEKRDENSICILNHSMERKTKQNDMKNAERKLFLQDGRKS